jgi:threonine/homoserine/homoserine lactone efflux protein
MISLSFLLTSLVVVAIPGTGVIFTVSTALGGSRRQSVVAALGCTLGIIPHLAAGILGISALLHSSALIFRIVKFAGVAYLAYLGYGLLSSRNSLELADMGDLQGDLKIVGKGVLLNLLNPKLTLFFLSFLPQFLMESSTSPGLQMLLLSLIFMGLTLVVFVLYGVLAHSFKKLLLDSQKMTRRIQQCFGVVLIGFAARLALSED